MRGIVSWPFHLATYIVKNDQIPPFAIPQTGITVSYDECNYSWPQE
jgi:hypothetical protein